MLFNFDLYKIYEQLKFIPDSPLIFSTSLFLILFFFFLLIYNLFIKNKTLRLAWLILFSFYFYYKSAGYYAGILIVSAAVNFLSGKWIASTEKFSLKKLYLLLALIINLGILSYFKYTNFILQIFHDITNSQFEPLDIFLPIGISFYTFKSLNYVFDIYFDTLKPTNSFRDFCVYVFFFPNILAGPIDRASDFLPQIDKEPFISKEDLGRAIFLIILGLFKKVVIADYISINFVDRVFDFPLRYTGIENLLAIYGYVLQVYCDFSGYSDMAIGISLMFGFRLMENFNYPFKATSIANFWRRWHISLSKWLLDYLFRPLQMKYRNLRVYGNMIGIFITFLICGLWHGAGWNYIYWGAMHGFMMSFALLIQKPKTKFYNLLKINNTKFLTIIQTIITFHLVAISFMIFRSSDIQTVFDMFSQIFTFFHGEVFIQFIERLPLISGLIFLGYLFHFMPSKLENMIINQFAKTPAIGKIIILVIAIWIAAQFKTADIQPFIYFQF
ncbi:MBOAT family O-acyltransferase [Rosettibacter firmus]|uniref:MBOAT family O-acyltransferase n=1 Tax=Rosettibacter firmus TaxID=3111522 RepID=UPI00336C11FD